MAEPRGPTRIIGGKARRIAWRTAAILCVCLPALVLAATPGLPLVLGGANSPFVPPPEIPGLFILTLLLGFFGGALSAASGACGGFLAVPALMGLGLRGVLAAGSELLALCLFGLLGGLDHLRSGKLHGRLALFLSLGSILGAAGGAFLTVRLYLDNPDRSDLFMALAQVLTLGVLAALAVRDLLRHLRGGAVKKAPPQEDQPRRRGPKDIEDERGKTAETPLEADSAEPKGFLALLRDSADPSKGAVSALIPLGLGLVSGFLLAAAGSCGGAPGLPALLGFLGFAPAPAVGAEMLQTGLSAGFAATFYTSGGLLIYTAASGLLLGLLSGLRLAKPVIRFIDAGNLKGFILAVILAVLGNRLLTLPAILRRAGFAGLPAALDGPLQAAAGFLVFMVPLAFTLWVLITLFSNLGALRRGAGITGPRARPLLLSALFTVLALVLLSGMTLAPANDGDPLMGAVDGRLLSRLKAQGPRTGDLEARLKALDGQALRLDLAFTDQRQASAVAAIIAGYGFNVAPSRNRVQVPYLDTKFFALQALADVEAVYRREGRAVLTGLGLPERSALHELWRLCRTLEVELARNHMDESAALYRRLLAEALEPAYNLEYVRPQTGPLGWTLFLTGFCALAALGLLWRAGGNLLLTGLGVAFLRDPVIPVPPPAEEPEQPAPKPQTPAKTEAKPKPKAEAPKKTPAPEAQPSAGAAAPPSAEAVPTKRAKPAAQAATEQAATPKAKPAPQTEVAPKRPGAASAAPAAKKPAPPAGAQTPRPAKKPGS
ncbi:TSUP family transporter [Desulfovibrio aminophilus]|uniref:TSUP family transporter n=1 Tax=Desulfovibrio aminophilus TaxID=81425 RepID=UPI00339A7FC1